MIKSLQQFFGYIENQFNYGGTKYRLADWYKELTGATEDKESTDVLFNHFSPSWLYGTLAKYVFRFSNLVRERDLLKISTYAFLMWLKRGYHLDRKAGVVGEVIDTNVETKRKFFPVFKKEVASYISYQLVSHDEPLKRLFEILLDFNGQPFTKINKEELYEIFSLCYYYWLAKIPEDKRGGDQDVYNEFEEEFEDTMINAANTYGGIYLQNDPNSLEELTEKYLGVSPDSGTYLADEGTKVKIKAKKGVIIIERIK